MENFHFIIFWKITSTSFSSYKFTWGFGNGIHNNKLIKQLFYQQNYNSQYTQ